MKLKYILLPCAMLIALTGCFTETIDNNPSQKEVVEENTEGNELTSVEKKHWMTSKKLCRQKDLN
ncbi:hypothetical protein J2T12_002225 [Paenibacillus anaericanus]|uniref:hypothetical protein n=1 Tax=Paenibacillus anaericanus TaxID=170367 RepID=UPI00278888E0|nr:hypothetical protein [Paenibacillus anaericanus]MDQ0088815.1 hypothetical protein [Paenibacillus anaericanus]